MDEKKPGSPSLSSSFRLVSKIEDLERQDPSSHSVVEFLQAGNTWFFPVISSFLCPIHSSSIYRQTQIETLPPTLVLHSLESIRPIRTSLGEKT